MEEALQFLDSNKEWLFGGIGVAAVGWLFLFVRGRSQKPENSSQLQISGDDSHNEQAGRDIKK